MEVCGNHKLTAKASHTINKSLQLYIQKYKFFQGTVMGEKTFFTKTFPYIFHIKP